MAYSNGAISQLTVRFQQSCGALTDPGLHGYLRWSRDDPTAPPAPGPASDYAWQPPAGVVPATGNYLYIASPPGDMIAGGQTFLDTEPDYNFLGSANSPLSVELSVAMPSYAHWWSLMLVGRYNQSALTTGYYPNVLDAPNNNPATGGLDFSGEGHGCPGGVRSFAVDQIAYDWQGLQSISVRFEQACGGPSPLHGALRWTRP